MLFLFPVFIYDNDNDDDDNEHHHHHHHHWSSKVHDLDLVLQRLNKQANNSLSYADDDNYNNNDNNDKKTTTTTQYLSIQSIHAINNILKVTSYRSAKNKTIYNGNTNNTESHKLKYVTGLWANRRFKSAFYWYLWDSEPTLEYRLTRRGEAFQFFSCTTGGHALLATLLTLRSK